MKAVLQKTRGIKFKLFLALISFSAVLIALLWLLQIVFLESTYKAIKTSAVKTSASLIQKNISNEYIGDLVERVAYANDVYIEISYVGTDERVHSQAKPSSILARMTAFETAQLYKRALESGGELMDYYSRADLFPKPRGDSNGNFVGNLPMMPQSQQQNLLFAKLMDDGDGNDILLLIEAEITPVDATVSTLRVQLWIISAAMLLIAVLLGMYLSRQISKPIVLINQQAKRLAQGEYDVQFVGGSYEEINELASTLSYAAYELGQTETLRKELIANVSHDLRTPLTLIEGYAEAMRDLPDENTPENAQIIIDEAKRLGALVSDMLDLSKFQAGTAQADKNVFDLNETFEQVAHRLGEFVRKDGYTIDFSGAGPCPVMADEGHLCQVLYNLLINAVNHIGPDNTVLVRLEKSQTQVTTFVTDHGKGIEQELLPRIWDRYFRAGGPGRNQPMGTGLGLSIVRSILNLYGGEYGIDSTLGQGTTIWFSLPLDHTQDIQAPNIEP